MFLMFVIGLEFNLHKLQAMRRHVLGLGSLQVVVTMVLTIAGTYLLDWMLPGDGTCAGRAWWRCPASWP